MDDWIGFSAGSIYMSGRGKRISRRNFFQDLAYTRGLYMEGEV